MKGIGIFGDNSGLSIRTAGRDLLTFHADGRVSIAGDLKPTDAAREFFVALSSLWADWVRVQQERGRL